MIRQSLRCCLVVLSLFALPLLRAQTTPEILAKAREWLGGEAALSAVQSVCYQGTITTEDGQKGSIEIIFQKPYQQRVTLTTPERIEMTVLDGYDAWQRIQDAKDPARWNLTILGPEQMKRLRANTFDNLNFFNFSAFSVGSIEDLGPAQAQGLATRKLVFNHRSGVAFSRYFDVASGRLVLTETDQGGQMIESGEILVNGLRFPKQLSNSNRGADNKVHTVVIDFEKVLVNETYAGSLFSIPMLSKH